jgi:uridine kinase
LAQGLKERLESSGSVSVLSEDAYYHEQNDRTIEERKLTNYDHPDSIDEKLLVQHLRQLQLGNSVDVPVYDYELHDRSGATVNLVPSAAVIVEGILLLHREAIRDIADLSVFVDAPEEVCLQRRIERDIAQRGRTRESVLVQYERTVGPMFRKFVAPSMEHADVIMKNVDSADAAVEKLIGEIRSRKLMDGI